MTLLVKNGGYAFLIRLNFMFTMSLWKEYELLQILIDLSIGEDTLWNSSFRLFHEMQFNTYFMTFNLISWNSYKICKKKASTNYGRKKMNTKGNQWVQFITDRVDVF